MAPYETTLSSKWPPSMQKMGVPLESYVPFEKEFSVLSTEIRKQKTLENISYCQQECECASEYQARPLKTEPILSLGAE